MSQDAHQDGCIFCKIARGEIPSARVYEDDTVFAVRDIQPLAKQHYLVIPKQHYKDWNDATTRDAAVWEKLARGVRAVSESQKLEQGFRVVANTGADGGQTVFHLHLHVLGGEPLGTFGR